jgi:acetate kinase
LKKANQKRNRSEIKMKILVINAGSSSLKYQLMDPDTGEISAKGLCERIYIDGRLTHKNLVKGTKVEREIPMPSHAEAIDAVLSILVDPEYGVIRSVDEIEAVGHRVLHGGDRFIASCIIDEACKQAIRDCIPLGPLHNPANLMGIEACEKAMPGKPQVAVFDTAFHMTMPPKAYRYAIPTKYYEEDHLRRYGFHGTSHRFVSKRAIELMGKPASELKIVVCHLGNGSSLSAVADGKCQDTSMGLSPLAGVPMGTRSGDIDTCVAQFIMNKYHMSADECLTMLNKKSGVLALSNGCSSDFRDLEAGAAKGDKACRLALDKFCYEVKKYVGAYAAALGGLDCLVFTAGVGENGPATRASVCEGLEFMGVKLDPARNQVRGEEALISADDSRVKVWVIPTNEELMIAQDTAELCK